MELLPLTTNFMYVGAKLMKSKKLIKCLVQENIEHEEDLFDR